MDGTLARRSADGAHMLGLPPSLWKERSGQSVFEPAVSTHAPGYLDIKSMALSLIFTSSISTIQNHRIFVVNLWQFIVN
jgi:hypothetical protein